MDGQNFDYKKVDESSIIALNDSTGVSGQFFLGSGTVDSEQVYNYAYKDGDEIKVDTKKCNVSSIKYTNDNYKVETYRGKLNSTVYNVLFFGLLKPEKEKYIFYVPKGSVSENYNVDLK